MGTGEVIAATVGVLIIIGTIMRFLQFIFKKMSKIDRHEKEIYNLKNDINSIKHSELDNIKQKIDEKVNALDKKICNDISTLEEKIDTLVKTIPSLEKSLIEAINSKYDKMRDKIEQIHERDRK